MQTECKLQPDYESKIKLLGKLMASLRWDHLVSGVKRGHLTMNYNLLQKYLNQMNTKYYYGK